MVFLKVACWVYIQPEMIEFASRLDSKTRLLTSVLSSLFQRISKTLSTNFLHQNTRKYLSEMHDLQLIDEFCFTLISKFIVLFISSVTGQFKLSLQPQMFEKKPVLKVTNSLIKALARYFSSKQQQPPLGLRTFPLFLDSASKHSKSFINT